MVSNIVMFNIYMFCVQMEHWVTTILCPCYHSGSYLQSIVDSQSVTVMFIATPLPSLHGLQQHTQLQKPWAVLSRTTISLHFPGWRSNLRWTSCHQDPGRSQSHCTLIGKLAVCHWGPVTGHVSRSGSGLYIGWPSNKPDLGLQNIFPDDWQHM